MRPVLVATAAAIAATSASAQVFTGLGFLPSDNFSKAKALSGDGLSVAGEGPRQTFGDARACWRWRSPTGLVDLGSSGLNVSGISADGSAIVGSHLDAPGNLPAVRWTEATGVQVIAGVYRSVLPNPGISGDGSVVVGANSSASTGDAVRWSAASGLITIPNPLATPLALGDVTNAEATNFDGSVVVGSMVAQLTGQPNGYIAPFRWVAGSGTEAIADAGIPLHGAALSVSANGTVVLIGDLSSLRRWTAATGAMDVPGLSINGTLAYPALSGDGGTIVSLDRVWSESAGTQELTALLTSAGCDFSGWSNLIVTGVDFDGHTFCGYGTDPQGLTEAWYATIPAPASALTLAPLLLIARRRARGR